MSLVSPLNQFADCLIRNGEVKEFIIGLMEKGANKKDIDEAVDEMLLRDGIHTIRSPKLPDSSRHW